MNPTRSLYCAILLLITQFSWADPRTDFDQAYKDYGLHITANNIADALDAAKNAHRLGTKVFGKKSVNVANLATNYAELLNDTEEFKKARKVLKGQLEILERRHEGWEIKKLAKEFSVSNQTVRKVLPEFAAATTHSPQVI